MCWYSSICKYILWPCQCEGDRGSTTGRSTVIFPSESSDSNSRSRTPLSVGQGSSLHPPSQYLGLGKGSCIERQTIIYITRQQKGQSYLKVFLKQIYDIPFAKADQKCVALSADDDDELYVLNMEEQYEMSRRQSSSSM